MIRAALNDAYEIRPGKAASGLLLVCDHAESRIPPELDGLGLPPDQLERHIAYDIGARDLTLALGEALGVPAVLSRFSRLVIDPNRGEDDPTLVMRLADGAIVPGNARLDAQGIAQRITRYYRPYDEAIARTLDTMEASGVLPVMLCLHSFTPALKGRARPWHTTVIWDHDPRLPRPLLAALAAEDGLVVGENQPYQGGLIGDTIDRHALPRGLAHALVEVRQDLLADASGIARWARRFARLLPPLLADGALHARHHFGTMRENHPRTIDHPRRA